MKTLVIYFSQTGKTKEEAAERIAQLSGADLVELRLINLTRCLIERRYLPH